MGQTHPSFTVETAARFLQSKLWFISTPTERTPCTYGINIVISTLFFTKLLSSLSASKQQVNVNANVGYPSLVIVALTIASPQIALKTLLVNNNASWNVCKRCADGGGTALHYFFFPEGHGFALFLPCDKSSHVEANSGSNSTLFSNVNVYFFLLDIWCYYYSTHLTTTSSSTSILLYFLYSITSPFLSPQVFINKLNSLYFLFFITFILTSSQW